MPLPDVNVLVDQSIEHTLKLLKFSYGQSKKVGQELLNLKDELLSLIQKHGFYGTSQSAKVRQQASLIQAASAKITEKYQELANLQSRMLNALGLRESQKAAGAILRAFGDQLDPMSVLGGKLRQLSNHTLIDGVLSKDWWKKQGEDLLHRFAQQIHQGVNLNETGEQVAARIFNGKKSSLMAAMRKQADALIDTSVLSVANNAGQLVFAESDEVEGFIRSAVLDPRTCIRCMSLDGALFKKDGTLHPDSPIKKVKFQGWAPIHWGCRCSDIPYTSGMNLPEKMSAQEWLVTKSLSYVKEALGKARAELFFSGNLTLADMVSPSGKILTLDQLY